MLKDMPVEPGFSLDAIVRITKGLSGSDLKEACRNAAMMPVREYIRENKLSANTQALEQLKLTVGSLFHADNH